MICLVFILYFCIHKMKAKESHINAPIHLFLMIVSFLLSQYVFAQNTDSSRIYLKTKAKINNSLPLIKGSVPTYQPKIYRYLPSGTNNSAANTENTKLKNDKILIVTRIYPMPLADQLNINFRLKKEAAVSIKLTDLLGNEISTLGSETISAGEHTRSYAIPAKLNAGMYFLRIVAGGEPVIKRVSVI